MDDDTIVADSAGHTMIEFDAIPAADDMAAEAEREEDEAA